MKRYLHWITGIVAVTMMAYFIWFLLKTFRAQDLSLFASTSVIVAIVIAAVLYVTIIPVSGWAWSLLLRRQGESWRVLRLASIMGVTQIAKYVPGNIAQHIGRATLAMGYGMKFKPFMGSVIHEALLTVAASLIVGMVLIGFSPLGLERLSTNYHEIILLTDIALTIGIFVLAIGSAVLPRALSQHPRVAPLLYRFGPVPGVTVTLCTLSAYCLNYLVIGIGIWYIAQAMGLASVIGYASLTAAFSLAWVFGFVTLGVPAGLGVREGVMTLLLVNLMPGHQLLALILATRIATILGDGLSFLFGVVAFRYLDAR